jgi:triosephosphate isomerase
MKHIFLNLKRFDVPRTMGGVNSLAELQDWGTAIVAGIQDGIRPYEDCEFAVYFPEAHILPAVAAKTPGSPVVIGCQGVYRADITPGGNFGAFTTNRPAAAAKAMGCDSVIIGHCEERQDKAGVLAEAGVTDPEAVCRLLNQEIKAALSQGLSVLYCVGETAEEKPDWQAVLRMQLETGLKDVDRSRVTIGYEPIWAIGPGKTPPGRAPIQETAQFIKEVTGGMDVVYGGGLKSDNAEMLASIPEIDGGLIALTRFSGEIGFYPEEYLEIVSLYLGK